MHAAGYCQFIICGNGMIESCIEHYTVEAVG